VFFDSSAYLALANTSDVYHQQAQTIRTRLQQEQWRTFTTNFVVAETHALFLVRLGRTSATAFLHGIIQSSTTTVRVSLRDEEQARATVFQYDDKGFSLTDAMSFAVMERLGIPYAFTFDRHFTQYGLAVLKAS
jgi:predicted nucleic acid-binding protein